MNLAACAVLRRGPEARTWYRAVELRFWQTALRTVQTKQSASRYNAGVAAAPPFEVLYLAEDHQVALHEVRAMYGPAFPQDGQGVIPNPQLSWTILNVRVALQQVADVTPVAEQTLLGTTAQELTGDWEGYQSRRPHHSVSQPLGIAPTQALGQALYAVPGLEGFRTLSARLPARMILVVFPQKLQPGSGIEFSDGMGRTHRIKPRPQRRPRTP